MRLPRPTATLPPQNVLFPDQERTGRMRRASIELETDSSIRHSFNDSTASSNL